MTNSEQLEIPGLTRELVLATLREVRHRVIYSPPEARELAKRLRARARKTDDKALASTLYKTANTVISNAVNSRTD
jgi:hypothetical protein